MKHHLFYKTSHSPSLVDLVGYQKAQKITDFCFISNPYYPTPAMIRELKDQLGSLISSYPSSDSTRSQRYIAEVLKVNPENMVVGNGATELITLVSENLIRRIAIPIPTFSEYLESLKSLRDAVLYPLDVEKEYHLDLDIYAKWIRQNNMSAALVINPGNPTGQFHSTQNMMSFLDQLRDLDLVIVDESFIDFAGDPVPSLLDMVDKYTNLIIIRSMSKHCGIPGLRLGYAYTANKEVRDRLRAAMPLWNVNSIAEYFLSMLPGTSHEYHTARMRVIGDMVWLNEELDSIKGLKVYRSGANFVLVKILGGRDSADLQGELLEKHHMYVRDCSNKVGMDNKHIRIASQGSDKDQILVKALEALLG